MSAPVDIEVLVKLHKLESMYAKFPEDVAIAAEDAMRFAADLVDDLVASDEPWPPMKARAE